MGFSATFKYGIVDNYTASIRKMQRATTSFKSGMFSAGKGATNLGNKLGKLSTKLANLRMGAAVMLIGRGLKGVVTESFNFEMAMQRVRAKAQPTTIELGKLRKEAERLGLTTKFSAVEAAEGMAMLGQKGYDTTMILKALPQVLSMATAGDLDLVVASDMVTGALYAFELGADKASMVADTFAIVSSRTAANMTDLSGALANAAPLAHAAGLQFGEVAALVGVMSNKNIRGGKSGTLLLNAFRNLIKLSDKGKLIFKKFGFNKDEVTDTKGHITDFTRLLELFEERGMGVQEIFGAFQLRGAKGVTALMGQTKDIRILRRLLQTEIGESQRQADIILGKIGKAVYEAISAWSGMKMAIGKALEPATIIISGWITAISRFVAASPKLSKTIGVFLAVSFVVLSVVAAIGLFLASLASIIILGPMVLSAIGGIFSFFAAEFVILGSGIALITGPIMAMGAAFLTLISPIGWVILAVAAIGTAVVLMRGKWGKLWEGIKQFASGFVKQMLWINDVLVKLFIEPFMNILLAIPKALGFFKGGKTEMALTSSMIAPDDLRMKNKVIVENVITGSIDVNDRTGGNVSVGNMGGVVPINVRQDTGYVF